MIPCIIMVGADKGGVGKTTVSRVVLDYLKARGVAFRAIDTEWPGGDLKRFGSSIEVIDIEKAEHQARVFDALEENGVTVVDIRAALLSPTLRAMHEIGLLDEVRAGGVNLALLHVLGPTIVSFGEIAVAAETVGGGTKHFLVKNHISRDSQYFEWDKDNAFAARLSGMRDMTITIPHLEDVAVEKVQKLGISFAAFGAEKAHGRVMSGYVRSFLEQCWREFDRVGLGKLLVEASN